MKASSLVTIFSTFTVVPIDPDDVATQVRAMGFQDEITFVGVSLDVRVIRGAFHQYVRRNGLYADPAVHVDIYYDRDQCSAWRRLVCCKELLHVLDHSRSRTVTVDDCEKLMDDLVGISSAGHLDPAAIAAFSDYLMTFYAIAILFPWDVREILMEQFASGHVTNRDIAEKLDLPLHAVNMVLSDDWPELYKLFAGRP